MYKIICWHCKKEFEYDGEQFRDVVCQCGAQNSVYDPERFEPLPAEDKDEENFIK